MAHLHLKIYLYGTHINRELYLPRYASADLSCSPFGITLSTSIGGWCLLHLLCYIMARIIIIKRPYLVSAQLTSHTYFVLPKWMITAGKIVQHIFSGWMEWTVDEEMGEKKRRRRMGGWLAGSLLGNHRCVYKYNRTLRWTIALRWPMFVTIVGSERSQSNMVWLAFRIVYRVPCPCRWPSKRLLLLALWTPYEVFVMLVTQQQCWRGR